MIVTAEKVEATVSDTSISITAIGSEMLEDMGIQSANEFVNYTCNHTRRLRHSYSRRWPRIFAPWVATQALLHTTTAFTRRLADRVDRKPLFDVERIEVLRGPQGTLCNRNSIGRAINYILKKPTETPYGLVRAQFGSNSNQEFYGVVSGPITDNLGVRVVASDRQTDPLLKSVTAGRALTAPMTQHGYLFCMETHGYRER